MAEKEKHSLDKRQTGSQTIHKELNLKTKIGLGVGLGFAAAGTIFAGVTAFRSHKYNLDLPKPSITADSGLESYENLLMPENKETSDIRKDSGFVPPSSPVPHVVESPPPRPPPPTEKEIPPTPTPLRQMVAIGNVDVFLGPVDRKVGYFIPGQKFTPTGVTSGDYTQVSDGRNTIWVRSGDCYRVVGEIPQVASRPPAQEPSQDIPTARPPTQDVPAPTRPPESALTATSVPEIVRAFPREVRSVEGLIIHNMGTKYGIDIYDGGFRGPDGTYNPGGGRTGYDSGLRQENLTFRT